MFAGHVSESKISYDFLTHSAFNFKGHILRIGVPTRKLTYLENIPSNSEALI